MSDSTTTRTKGRPSTWDNLRENVGWRVNSLGDNLAKLGDRICGDEPMGLNEAWECGYLDGQRTPTKPLRRAMTKAEQKI